jgi:hypothetical protein
MATGSLWVRCMFPSIHLVVSFTLLSSLFDMLFANTFSILVRISYFITTFLFMIYWIEDNTLRRVARAIETGRLSSRSQREEGRAEEVLIMLD